MREPNAALPAESRVPLYDRLPEIYRERDAAQQPSDRLRSFLGLAERVFGSVHDNIEALYHDLFIETCEDWVVPYIADLLGLSHLSGDPWTLRADVANAIALRRRKGTLGAIELLTYSLTQWGVHAVELYRSLAWTQHLNHQRPDAGGRPPYTTPTVDRFTPVRGGTAVVRDPATLTLVDTPFDPFARIPDLRTPVECDAHRHLSTGDVRYNLPNLAIFLWRLETYRIETVVPVHVRTAKPGIAGAATRVACFEVHPLGVPVRLFNVSRFREYRRNLRRALRFHAERFGPETVPDDQPPRVSVDMDDAPGPILPARLQSMRPPMYRGESPPSGSALKVGTLWLNAETEGWSQWLGPSTGWVTLEDPVATELIGGAQGEPDAYVSLDVYDEDGTQDVSERALQLHLPRAMFHPFKPDEWTFRGANLCAWEQGLARPLAKKEIAIDPVLGRVALGVTPTQATALEDGLRVTHTYGTVGAVGAHPVDRTGDRLPGGTSRPVTTHVVGPKPPQAADGPAYVDTLQEALAGATGATGPMVIEIPDSRIHDVDLSAIDVDDNGQPNPPEQGGPNLRLGASVTIRAGAGELPIIRLAQPLRFRPGSAVPAAGLDVRLEGLFITRGKGFPADESLIARAALNALDLCEVTLDPGGRRDRDPSKARGPIHLGITLEAGDPGRFRQTPTISLERTISGPLRIGRGHRLCLVASILDAGVGVGDEPGPGDYALTGPDPSPEQAWGPDTEVNGATFFGRVRVGQLRGRGGLWVHRLEVLEHQKHCVKYSYFSGDSDRLPQHHACVVGEPTSRSVPLRFTSEAFGDPGYGQLSLVTDFRIRERGPDDDAMGAFGFLQEAHKWRNLEIRYREFMPVGVRPLLVPVT